MKKNKGFTLVGAIFFIVVLSLLSSVMVSIFNKNIISSSNIFLRSKLYYASYSGIQWGVKSIDLGSDCASDINGKVLNIKGINVNMICISNSYTEAGKDIKNYYIEASSDFKSYGDISYIVRKLSVSFTR